MSLPMALYTRFFSSGWSANACSTSGRLAGVVAGIGTVLGGAGGGAAAEGRDEKAVNCDIWMPLFCNVVVV